MIQQITRVAYYPRFSRSFLCINPFIANNTYNIERGCVKVVKPRNVEKKWKKRAFYVVNVDMKKSEGN